MSTRKRKEYPYSVSAVNLTQSYGRPSRKQKKRIKGRYVILPLLAVIGVVTLYSLVFSKLIEKIEFSPFARTLKALRFHHNGQEVILTPGSQVVVNPRDTVQLLDIQTDGLVSWGTRVVAPDADLGPMMSKSHPIREVLPKEEFETPRLLEITVLQWSRPLGKVSFLIQLDAKDWLQKANATADAARRIGYLEKALQESPGNILVKTQLAGLYFDTKKYDAAARLYREIDESGKSKSILERLLTVYQVQNKVQDAMGVYVDLMKLSEEPEVFKEFFEYMQKHASREQAARFLEKHQQDIPKAFQSSVLLYMAELNTQSKNWSKAAASYEKAIKAGVKDSDVLYNLAVTYQQSDDQDKAIQALQRYLEKNPGDTKSLMQLAALQEKKGALSQARESYEAVLRRNPQNKEAQVRLIAVLEKAHDKAGLQATYERLAQLQPKNKTVRHNLGVLYYEAKKWDKATESFEAVAAMDPKDLESRKYLLDLHRRQKNEKGEAAVLQNLAQLDPKNPGYYEAIFKSYDDKKDYKGMVTYFRAAAERNKDSVAFHNYVLYGLLKTGDNKGAARQIEQLIRLQPKEKKHLRQAANLYETAGDYSEALKKLEQLMKLDPNDKDVKEEYMRIKLLTLTRKNPG